MSIPVCSDGTIEIVAFIRASDDVWNEWLEARLRGVDTTVPGGTAANPDRHLTIANLYDRLDVDQRRRLRRLLLHLLTRIHAEGAAHWPAGAAIASLRLIEVVLRDSSDSPVATRLLLAFLQKEDLDPRVRQRVLQTLVGLGDPTQRRFLAVPGP